MSVGISASAERKQRPFAIARLVSQASFKVVSSRIDTAAAQDEVKRALPKSGQTK